jgi:hypothetical protein
MYPSWFEVIVKSITMVEKCFTQSSHVFAWLQYKKIENLFFGIFFQCKVVLIFKYYWFLLKEECMRNITLTLFKTNKCVWHGTSCIQHMSIWFICVNVLSIWVLRNMGLFHNSLCNLILHHRVNESLEYKNCWTREKMTIGLLPSNKMCLKIAIKILCCFLFKLDYLNYPSHFAPSHVKITLQGSIQHKP